ncbi:MAG: glycerol-3-phosphate dehydrogenase C-terminal domain-containing protein [Pseudomonadota bacterium]
MSVFGGKITTYRVLAEGVMARLKDHFPSMDGPWTAGAALPGGDFPVNGVGNLVADLVRHYDFLDERWAKRLVRAYGSEARDVLGDARTLDDLGEVFGATLTAREVAWLMEKEFARTAEDVLWRRSKLGLRLTSNEVAALDAHMSGQVSDRAVARG